MAISPYYRPGKIAREVGEGNHRKIIGGQWDELGELQLNFLTQHGLKPNSTLLDLGCGSLRLGVRAVGYLEPDHYWGTDINEPLLQAGYEKEIVPAGLAHKLPRQQLIANGDFDCSRLPKHFDFIIAQSLFTHLPPVEFLRRCLANLSQRLTGPSAFFATFFIAPTDKARSPLVHARGGKTSYPDQDPYHYTVDDVQAAARDTRWTFEMIGEWGHPRDLKMVAFRLG